MTTKIDLTVPKMGESINEAHIGQIFKPSGSIVAQDDEILELETDKVNIALFAPKSGKVTLTVNPQDKVKIEQVIGFIEEGALPQESPPVQVAPPPPIGEKTRLTQADFLETFKETAPAPTKTPTKTATRTKLSRIRQTIAARLVEAKSRTAMLTTFNEVDMTEILRLREAYKEPFLKKFGVKLGFMPFFIKAACSALKEFPVFASYMEEDELVSKPALDLGVAVSTERGLIVPVLRHADQLDFAEIEKGIENFSKKAREGGLSVDDLTGGVFTITNGGTFGSLLSTPILNFPQSGILGMHKIEKRAVVIGDEIKIRSMMYLALTYDHRVVDGREAVLFLVHVKNRLEDPSRFLLGI